MKTTTLVCLALATAGCGGTQPPPKTTTHYVRARAALDPPRPKPVVVEVPASTHMQGQMKPMPAKTSEPTKVTTVPQEVVATANRNAAQGPDEHAYFNAIMQYAYEPGTLYQVFAAPMRVTDLILQPGEKILGQPASGDVVRWVLALGKSMDAGVEQWHVYLKPTRPDLETNLAINTDRRTYLLELHSYTSTYMAAVKWAYAQDQIARLESENQALDTQEKTSAPIVALDALNFNYALQVVKGKPVWTPVQVFDDGRRTFIRFPQTMLVREAPALFVLRDKETQLVNYRMKGDFYVVDRLVDSAELRVGQQDQEIVRIVRTTPQH